MSGHIVHISVAGPIHAISVRGKIVHFEDHHYCGPMLCRKNGDPLENQRYSDFFWTAVSLWYHQGKRIENGLCVWDHEPVAITEKRVVAVRERRVVERTRKRTVDFVIGYTPAEPGA